MLSKVKKVHTFACKGYLNALLQVPNKFVHEEKTATAAKPCVLCVAWRGCCSVSWAWDWHTAQAGSIPRCSNGFFSQSQLQCRLSVVFVYPCVQLYYINTCVHVKRSSSLCQSLMEYGTPTQPVCTVGWVVQLFCSWLFLGKATYIFHGRSSSGTISLLNKQTNKHTLFVDRARALLR